MSDNDFMSLCHINPMCTFVNLYFIKLYLSLKSTLSNLNYWFMIKIMIVILKFIGH